ncbi:MAG: DUF2946 family protein [Pseudomonadota bacterium]|nr:DUF2946 family protein [Pseudomonadota bacterium]
MEDWVHRALERWPNVPALYGWLGLDRRGRWTIKGELITRPQIIDTINRNYAADDAGRWYFQNGPQRGYVSLASAPLVLRADADGALFTHTNLPVTAASTAWLDENGGLLLHTAHGPAALDDQDLEWLLQRLSVDSRAVSEDEIFDALALPSGTPTALNLTLAEHTLAVTRLDLADAPTRLGFQRSPAPDAA